MPGPPIRKPSDHSPPAGSPRNIAGHHVLHRPLMPRHPPNAHKNKQHNTRQNTCRRLTVRCSRPLYSSQPTHPHPPTTPDNQEPQTGQATRAHYPRTPTACHPHTHKHAQGHPPPPTGSSGRVFYTKHQTTNHPTQQCTTVSRPAFRESNPLGRPRPTRPRQPRPGSHPTQYLSLERR